MFVELLSLPVYFWQKTNTSVFAEKQRAAANKPIQNERAVSYQTGDSI